MPDCSVQLIAENPVTAAIRIDRQQLATDAGAAPWAEQIATVTPVADHAATGAIVLLKARHLPERHHVATRGAQTLQVKPTLTLLDRRQRPGEPRQTIRVDPVWLDRLKDLAAPLIEAKRPLIRQDERPGGPTALKLKVLRPQLGRLCPIPANRIEQSLRRHDRPSVPRRQTRLKRRQFIAGGRAEAYSPSHTSFGLVRVPHQFNRVEGPLRALGALSGAIAAAAARRALADATCAPAAFTSAARAFGLADTVLAVDFLVGFFISPLQIK
jgi:hypothetical protein